jgi:Ca2+/Na+ antiporter
MIDIKKIFILSFLINIVLVIYFLIFGEENYIINLEFAYFTSSFVIFVTFQSYKNKILKGVDNYENHNEQDLVDKIDDPHGLWDDDTPINNQEEFTQQEIKEIIKEEKQKANKNSFKNMFKSLPTFLSFYRFFGYALLIVGFLYLLRHQYFVHLPYFIGLSILPISVIIGMFLPQNLKKES